MKEIEEQLILLLKNKVPELKQIVINSGQTELDILTAVYPLALINIHQIEFATVRLDKKQGITRMEIELHPAACKAKGEIHIKDIYSKRPEWWNLIAKVDSTINRFRSEGIVFTSDGMRHKGDFYPCPIVMNYMCCINIAKCPR